MTLTFLVSVTVGAGFASVVGVAVMVAVAVAAGAGVLASLAPSDGIMAVQLKVANHTMAMASQNLPRRRIRFGGGDAGP
ncbi:hypothetical protein ACFPA8_14570 [Streptomyces ovatisporus]|uniref:Secreted protein n=1 Tax=Streptomyces ovatisporus TaxID=1128682 RepID=A0ABV9A7W1_9ACTN